MSPQEKGPHELPGLDAEAIQSRIVERILTSLRAGPGLVSAGYTQSEGKNYGKYEKDGSAFELPDQVERLVRQVAREEADRIERELRQTGPR